MFLCSSGKTGLICDSEIIHIQSMNLEIGNTSFFFTALQILFIVAWV